MTLITLTQCENTYFPPTSMCRVDLQDFTFHITRSLKDGKCAPCNGLMKLSIPVSPVGKWMMLTSPFFTLSLMRKNDIYVMIPLPTRVLQLIKLALEVIVSPYDLWQNLSGGNYFYFGWTLCIQLLFGRLVPNAIPAKTCWSTGVTLHISMYIIWHVNPPIYYPHALIQQCCCF